MIDFGLLLSMLAVLVVPTVVAFWWPLAGGASFADLFLLPAFAGLFVGRLVTVAIEDPASLTSVANILIIRSGVEFWPGVVVGAAVFAYGQRGGGVGVWALMARMALLGPLLLVAYAAYEATCVFRDGCFGPESPIGLRPAGLSTTMLPVGWLVAAAVVGLAFIVRRRTADGPTAAHGAGESPGVAESPGLGESPEDVESQGAGEGQSVAERTTTSHVLTTVLIGVGGVAVIRSVASIWLPHASDTITRQHVTSLAVAAVSVVGLVVLQLTGGERRRHDQAPRP